MKLRTMTIVVAVAALAVAALASAGDIQVVCEPGLRVYLDGKLVGTSSAAEDGFFLMDVAKGAHTVRVEKDGFVPRTFEVDVPELPIEVKVEALAPLPSTRKEPETPRPDVEQLVGSLVVTSAPQNCEVEIDGKPQTKSTPYLSIGGLAEGQHTIAFSKPGFDRISGVFSVHPGAVVTVRGNLKGGKVEVVHQGKGSLRVNSHAVGSTVLFMGKPRDMTSNRMNLSYIPAGEYKMVVWWRGREQSTRVVIADGQRTIVTVSFMPGDVPFVISTEPE
jgi:hypothetical protein